MEIDDLVLAVQGRDSRAWTELALRLAADLRPFLRRWFDDDDVKDLVQTTLITVHHKLPEFEVRPGEPCRNWVRMIARIEAKQALRQRARARRLVAAAELAAAPQHHRCRSLMARSQPPAGCSSSVAGQAQHSLSGGDRKRSRRR